MNASPDDGSLKFISRPYGLLASRALAWISGCLLVAISPFFQAALGGMGKGILRSETELRS
ncbi:hypothetical protein [Kingella sp. (in: b-proteobacteria)]|uniref:hypothetical protein n=1 Tax=Kingella sp. (in: b-proteobacteria) TaxID=2020713 RepID=UPI0026DB5087|nr:hypothetical protein [Kingella sp. (in: b-proteobacteria)]MDO4656999.1 hypothetical protein [Kingella sp. (in: b-proteobacteria)]